MNATADDQYMQLYCQPLTDGMECFSDATVVTTTPTPTLTPNMMMSSSVSSTPKSSSNSLKPIRRRSSISKRTHPITLLNANTTNFRALVQQFTGCPTPTPTSTFPLFHKGPITLNFQQGTKQHNIHQHDTTTRPIIMTPFGSNNQAHQVDVPVPLPLQKQHILMQEQQSNFVPTSGNPCRPGFDVFDGLPMNINDFSLHELTVKNPFSNVLCDENVYEGFNYAVTP